MIVTGIILAFLGYWFLPAVLPGCPPQIDSLLGGLGVLLVVVGVVLWILGSTGHAFGGRRHYW